MEGRRKDENVPGIAGGFPESRMQPQPRGSPGHAHRRIWSNHRPLTLYDKTPAPSALFRPSRLQRALSSVPPRPPSAPRRARGAGLAGREDGGGVAAAGPVLLPLLLGRDRPTPARERGIREGLRGRRGVRAGPGGGPEGAGTWERGLRGPGGLSGGEAGGALWGSARGTGARGR